MVHRANSATKATDEEGITRFPGRPTLETHEIRVECESSIYLVLIFALGLISAFAQVSGSPSSGIAVHDSESGVQKSATVTGWRAADGATASAQWPQLVDITASTGIKFEHLSSPEQKYIVESMSGGVALIDYDRDGWPDIYFTNAQSVEMALAGKKARSALYHNNHDGTFTDVTDKAGVGYPCWAMGAVVGDYNNDGWPDLLVTCFGGVVLYRNNGDGTFTDVTKQSRPEQRLRMGHRRGFWRLRQRWLGGLVCVALCRP